MEDAFSVNGLPLENFVLNCGFRWTRKKPTLRGSKFPILFWVNYLNFLKHFNREMWFYCSVLRGLHNFSALSYFFKKWIMNCAFIISERSLWVRNRMDATVKVYKIIVSNAYLIIRYYWSSHISVHLWEIRIPIIPGDTSKRKKFFEVAFILSDSSSKMNEEFLYKARYFVEKL